MRKAHRSTSYRTEKEVEGEKGFKKKREDKTKIDVSIIRFALHSLMVW